MILLQQLRLYYNTLRYLKGIQIRYQIIHRIKQSIVSIHFYSQHSRKNIFPVLKRYPPCIHFENVYQGDNQFLFLNKTKKFNNGVNWNFQDFGKLWNYNLQYFDFLHDKSIAEQEKISWVDSFAKAILTGEVKAEPFPVSLRLVNWVLFYSSSNYQGEEFKRSLLLQIGYLEKNREFHLLANHLLENNISLAICGFALRDEQFTRRYMQSVLNELDRQVHPDGGHYEGSPMYHCLLLAKLLLLIDVAENHTYELSVLNLLKKKASVMLGWLAAFCLGTKSYSFVNDAAPGIAPEPAELFERGRLMGLEWQPTKLQKSGYRMLGNEHYHLLIDVANIMPAYQPGHAHSDLFHFAMWYQGEPVFSEAGTSTYENNPRRWYERSTVAHNTVSINDGNQSEVWGSFRVGKRAEAIILDDSLTIIKASHNGYVAKYGITHTRTFSLMNPEFLAITDELFPMVDHSCKAVALFHLEPSILVTSIIGNTVQLSNQMKIIFHNADAIESSMYEKAVGFNQLIPAPMISVHFSGKLQTQIFII